jgi:hypothetical protein
MMIMRHIIDPLAVVMFSSSPSALIQSGAVAPKKDPHARASFPQIGVRQYSRPRGAPRRRTTMANPENERTADDANTDEQVDQVEATEDIRDLEPEQEVKGGWPSRYEA